MLQEFAAWHAGNVPPRVLDAFRYGDRNNSGYLDARELRDVLGYYGLDASSSTARDMVMRYDDRPDGKPDVYEFAALVAQLGVLQRACAYA